MKNTYEKTRLTLLAEHKNDKHYNLPPAFAMTQLDKLTEYYEIRGNPYKLARKLAQEMLKRKCPLRLNGRPFIEFGEYFENPEDFLQHRPGDLQNMLNLERLQDEGKGAETEGRWTFMGQHFPSCEELYRAVVRFGVEAKKSEEDLPPTDPKARKEWNLYNTNRNQLVKSKMTLREADEKIALYRESMRDGSWDAKYMGGMFSTAESSKAARAAGKRAQEAAELRGDFMHYTGTAHGPPWVHVPAPLVTFDSAPAPAPASDPVYDTVPALDPAPAPVKGRRLKLIFKATVPSADEAPADDVYDAESDADVSAPAAPRKRIRSASVDRSPRSPRKPAKGPIPAKGPAVTVISGDSDDTESDPDVPARARARAPAPARRKRRRSASPRQSQKGTKGFIKGSPKVAEVIVISDSE